MNGLGPGRSAHVDGRGPGGSAPMGDLGPLFGPRGVAVVGASRDPGKLGAAMARSLSGFGGFLALVNARDDTMHPSVGAAAAAGPVDLAVLCVPAAACAGVLAEAAQAGVRAAVVCGGGFAEAGGAGIEHQRRLAALARDSGLRLLGPNTSGFLAPHARLTASFVPGAHRVRPGAVAVVAASGGVNHALAFALTEAGHGVSLAVGLGNAAGVTAPDVLDHLAGDPRTAAVALHVESVADGPRLVESVRRLTATRPVVALVVGRHDVGAFAASHTGALATSWRTTRAALAQAGAVLVDDERELVDAVGALAVTRASPCADPGVGIVTAQAGPGLLLLDDLRGRGIRVPELAPGTRETLAGLLPPLTFQRNPVDTGRPGPELGAVLAATGADPGVDVIAGYVLHEPDAVDVVAAVAEGLTAGVPVVLGLAGTGDDVVRDRMALRGSGVPVAADARGVAAATAALLADARARPARPAASTLWRAPAVPPGRYDEHTGKALLGRLGLATMPPSRREPGRRRGHAGPRARGARVRVRRAAGRGDGHAGGDPGAHGERGGRPLQAARTARRRRGARLDQGREDRQEGPQDRHRRPPQGRARRGVTEPAAAPARTVGELSCSVRARPPRSAMSGPARRLHGLLACPKSR